MSPQPLTEQLTVAILLWLICTSAWICQICRCRAKRAFRVVIASLRTAGISNKCRQETIWIHLFFVCLKPWQQKLVLTVLKKQALISSFPALVCWEAKCRGDPFLCSHFSCPRGTVGKHGLPQNLLIPLVSPCGEVQTACFLSLLGLLSTLPSSCLLPPPPE